MECMVCDDVRHDIRKFFNMMDQLIAMHSEYRSEIKAMRIQLDAFRMCCMCIGNPEKAIFCKAVKEILREDNIIDWKKVE